MPRFEVDWTVSADDFLEVAEMMRPTYLLVTRVASAAGLVAGAALVLLGQWYGFIIAAAALGLFVGSSRSVLRWRFRRRARHLIGRTAHAVVDETGVEIHDPGGDSRFEWPQVTEMRASPRTMVLSHDQGIAGWIGLESLDAATRQQLVDFVSSRLAEPAE